MKNSLLVRYAFREKFLGSELLVFGLWVRSVFFGVVLPIFFLLCWITGNTKIITYIKNSPRELICILVSVTYT